MTPREESTGLVAARELEREGRLLAEYERLPRLLAAMPWSERARVGGWLARTAARGGIDAPVCRGSLRVAVTGNATVAGLVSHLLGQAAAHAVWLDVDVSDYGRYRQDLIEGDSDVYARSPQIVACLLDAHVVADELPRPWQVADAEATLERRRAEIETLVGRFEQQSSNGVLILNTIPLERTLANQLVDLRSRSRLGAAWRRFNAWLLELGAERDRIVTIDLETAASDVTLSADARMETYAHQHFPEGALACYAREVVDLARNLLGLTRKCIVLDLDNTLWGGVLSETGAEGIVLGDDLEGEAFRRFQTVLAQLAAQGVLLAIASKNDIDDVKAVLARHPDMVLREDAFVAISANWRPKSDNISEIAGALNLGADSFVFVDDSPFECELVAESHRNTAVVRVESDPALHVHSLLREGWFSTRELTREDRARVATYRSQAERRGFLDNCDSLEQYLRGLDIRVTVGPPSDLECKRVSQLTLRTNQFNLATARMDLGEVRRAVADPQSWVWAIRSSDRFGEDGLVGCVFARERGDTLSLENFLLSCRVFSRGIETAALAEVLQEARRRGFREVTARYRPSPKNSKVRDFYPRHGFRRVLGDKDTECFVHDLTAIPARPDHIAMETTAESEAA